MVRALCVGACTLMMSLASAKEARFTTPIECNSIVDSALRSQCLNTVLRGNIFPFTAEFQKQESRPAFDTTVSKSVTGADTTLVFAVSPAHKEVNLKPEAESMAGSLRFMAVMSGLSFALSVATFIVILAK